MGEREGTKGAAESNRDKWLLLCFVWVIKKKSKGNEIVDLFTYMRSPPVSSKHPDCPLSGHR